MTTPFKEIDDFNPPDFWLDSPSPSSAIKEPVPFESERLTPKQLLYFEKEATRAMINSLWNKFFYYFTWLESLNVSAPQGADSGGDTEANITMPGSWDTATSGSATLSFGSAGCVLSTGATSGSASGIAKRPLSQNIIRFDKIQRFRTAFRLSAITNQTAYLIRGGTAQAGASFKYFGFRITGSTLQGTVENNNASTRTNLDLGVTLVADTTYEVEARFFPKEKVIFLVKNSAGEFEERGIITTLGAAGIPAGTTEIDFFEFYISNSAAEAKQLTVSYVEYIQER